MNANHWLSVENEAIQDWIICDIYQQEVDEFKSVLDLLTLLTNKLSEYTCLTLNLPDSSDQEVNICLTVLQQLQKDHKIIYFQVPNYLNIIIHLLPKQWQTDNVLKRNKHSYLPKRTFLRWREFWRCKNSINRFGN